MLNGLIVISQRWTGVLFCIMLSTKATKTKLFFLSLSSFLYLLFQGHLTLKRDLKTISNLTPIE